MWKTSIESVNADSLRTQDSFARLTQTLTNGRIDIARIQETHNERIDTQENNRYNLLRGR